MIRQCNYLPCTTTLTTIFVLCKKETWWVMCLKPSCAICFATTYRCQIYLSTSKTHTLLALNWEWNIHNIRDCNDHIVQWNSESCSLWIIFTKIDVFLSGRVTGFVTKFTVRQQILMGLRVIRNILLDVVLE